jgi:hypothetical protein
MDDEFRYCLDQLARLEKELAALARQYGRAVDDGDAAAQQVEAEAICDRVKWLLYHHLDLRIGMGSDDWVWLNDNEGLVDRTGDHVLQASGRIWCSLPETGHRHQWSEPFAAKISHSPIGHELCDYIVNFGSAATILDVAMVRRVLAGGGNLNPRPPDDEDDWAFVFRMGEHT